jgi:hypothetical protein
MMKSNKPTDQQILDAKIAPAADRWSPGRENPAIGMAEDILRTLAKHDEGARRAVQLADAWAGPEVPGNKLDAFLCGLLSGHTVKNLDSLGKEPRGKRSFGEKKTTYEKWPLTMWVYENYFCDKKYRKKPIEEQLRERGLDIVW